MAMAAATGRDLGPGAVPFSGDDAAVTKTITALEDMAAAIPTFAGRLQSKEQLDERQQTLVQRDGCTEDAGDYGEHAQFRVRERIGYGTFCVVFRGELLSSDQGEGGAKPVAVKFELRKTDSTQLRNEYRMYKRFTGTPGIAKIYSFGEIHFHKVLVMDLLGPSLEALFQDCGRKFSVKTVAMLAKQMLARIQSVHEFGIIYRDIKPENFLIGLPQTQSASTVFVVDFGMAKIYRDPHTKAHIPFGEAQSLSGTARYMSINAHSRRSQSRRDDLEALGHVFMYFLRGSLPWQGIRGVEHDQRYDMMFAKKQATTIADLCSGFPNEFADYLSYTRRLTFDGDPDYDYLQGLFTQVLTNLGETDDGVFDWTRSQSVASEDGTADGSQDMNKAPSTPPAPPADKIGPAEPRVSPSPDAAALPPSSPPGKRRRSEFTSDLKPPTHIRPKKTAFFYYDTDAQKVLITLYREVMAKRYAFHRAVGRGSRPGSAAAAAAVAAAAAAAALADAEAALGTAGAGGSRMSYRRPRTPMRTSGTVISQAFSTTLDKTLGQIISELEDLSDKMLQGGDWTGVVRVGKWFKEVAAAVQKEIQRLQAIAQQTASGQESPDEVMTSASSPVSDDAVRVKKHVELEVPEPGMDALSLEVDADLAATNGKAAGSGGAQDTIDVGDNMNGDGDDGEDETYTLVYRTASGSRRVLRVAADKP